MAAKAAQLNVITLSRKRKRKQKPRGIEEMKIAVLPGDGIGPEIMTQALRVLNVFKNEGMPFEFTTRKHCVW